MGCSGTPSGSAGFAIPEYSKKQRKQVHDEIIGCNAQMTIEFLKDYKVLRDQVRVK